MRSAKEPIRVLVVDDSYSMRIALAGMLEDFAYRVELAEDGEDGLERFADFAPDIVLLDMNMPRLDGLGFIRRVRGELADQRTFIIMVTSDLSPGLKLKAFTAGADDFLKKPFDRAELLARVAVAARQVRQDRRLRLALESIGREIDQISALQRRLLPDAPPDLEGVRIESLYNPSGKASGDYFDHFVLPGGNLRAVMADVSGHGARAAFIMGIVRTLVRMTRTNYMPLTELLGMIDAHLRSIIGQEPDFVTLMAVDVDFTARRLDYVNAGHCPGLLRHGDGRIQRLDPTATVLGFFELEFPATSVPLGDAASLFMFTDGFYDWELEPGRLLDFDAFWAMAVEQARRPGHYLEQLMEAVAGRMGEQELRDDLSALWLDMRLDPPPHGTRPGARDEPEGRAGGGARYVVSTVAGPESVRRAVKAAMAVLTESIRDEAVLGDLELALTEACSNVAMHAYPHGMPGELEIVLRLEPPSGLLVEVADRGRGFQPRADIMREPEPTAESGRGMYIISKLMDGIDILRREGKNIVVFRKTIGKDAWKDCS